ncbi:MAG: hypothetical protein ACREFJ_01915 [Acetobacteraceae bacterium]
MLAAGLLKLLYPDASQPVPDEDLEWALRLAPYWDGGYAGNPTMTPLVREGHSDDTILIPINPVERPGSPRSAGEILNRLNEISFNSALLKELRMMALLRQIADPGNTEGARWARMRIQLIKSDIVVKLGHSSKLNAEWPFLLMLRDEGRGAAEAFLATNGEALGKRSTLPIEYLLTEI